MSKLREVAQQALEAMSTIRPYEIYDYDPIETAITALRAALSQPEFKSTCAECGKSSQDGWALYCVECLESAPSKPKWIGLTYKEKLALVERFYGSEIQRLEAVEAALKEKNT